MLKIAMSEISRLFDAIQAVDELYLPVEKGNRGRIWSLFCRCKGAS